MIKKQILEYELEMINEVTETRRQANKEIYRPMLESELEMINAELRAKDSPTPQASNHRQAHIVH